MSPPMFVIVVGLEEPVRVYADAATDGQLARLDKWVRDHPEVDDLRHPRLRPRGPPGGGVTLAHVDHVCAVCGSDCDTVTELKTRNRDLEREVLRLGFMLHTFERALGVEDGATGEWFPEKAA